MFRYPNFRNGNNPGGQVSLLRHPAYSAINILGLAIGMACCVLALLYIRHEFDYDRFHPNGKQIYRILQGHRGEDGEFSYDTGASPALSSRLRDGYPFVVRTTRIWRRWGLWMRQGKEGFNQVFWLVDPDFLDMFDFPLVNGGDAGAVLSRPGSILVTEDMAKQQFGDRDPVGEILTVDHRFFKGATRSRVFSRTCRRTRISTSNA